MTIEEARYVLAEFDTRVVSMTPAFAAKGTVAEVAKLLRAPLTEALTICVWKRKNWSANAPRNGVQQHDRSTTLIFRLVPSQPLLMAPDRQGREYARSLLGLRKEHAL